MFIQDAHFKSCDLINHGFFGRKGGVSEGVYKSLNVGFGTKDDPENVAENRARVAKALDVEPDNLITLHQTHSPDCFYIGGKLAGYRPQADAMVTDIEGIAIGVLTADCVPVLFYGKKKFGPPVIGAAHAGWGGALKGVLQNTVKMMREKGAETISAAIGPCIRQQSYEVSDEFMAKFVGQHSDNQVFFMDAGRAGHQMFDLPGYVDKILRQVRVERIGDCGIDTYNDEDNYFSYRRATHRQEPDYGRQISAIVIKR